MIEISFLQIIEIYSWVLISSIMIFMAAIARFYQKKFGIKTFYYFYSIPIISFLTTAIHLFSYDTLLSETIELLGMIVSLLTSFYLYRLMVGIK